MPDRESERCGVCHEQFFDHNRGQLIHCLMQIEHAPEDVEHSA